MQVVNKNYIVKTLGCQEYQKTWDKMHAFVNSEIQQDNEVWLLEHFPVFTQGIAGKAEHVLQKTPNIPLVQTDRGGQVTYHAPGQLIVYPLIHLDSTKITFRQVITALEESTNSMLNQYNINSYADPKRPGVYVDGKKIASVGLRVKNGWVTHGLAINVNLDLTPFKLINPCGIKNLEMTSCSDLGGPKSIDEAMTAFMPIFNKKIEKFIQEK